MTSTQTSTTQTSTETTSLTTTVPFHSVCDATLVEYLVLYGTLEFDSIAQFDMGTVATARFTGSVRQIINKILDEFSYTNMMCGAIKYVDDDLRKTRKRAVTKHLTIDLFALQSFDTAVDVTIIGLLLIARLEANADLSSLVNPLLAPGEGYRFIPAPDTDLTKVSLDDTDIESSLSEAAIGGVVAAVLLVVGLVLVLRQQMATSKSFAISVNESINQLKQDVTEPIELASRESASSLLSNEGPYGGGAVPQYAGQMMDEATVLEAGANPRPKSDEQMALEEQIAGPTAELERLRQELVAAVPSSPAAQELQRQIDSTAALLRPLEARREALDVARGAKRAKGQEEMLIEAQLMVPKAQLKRLQKKLYTEVDPGSATAADMEKEIAQHQASTDTLQGRLDSIRQNELSSLKYEEEVLRKSLRDHPEPKSRDALILKQKIDNKSAAVTMLAEDITAEQRRRQQEQEELVRMAASPGRPATAFSRKDSVKSFGEDGYIEPLSPDRNGNTSLAVRGSPSVC